MKKYIIFSLLAFKAITGFGQDIHFSQFFNTPQVLNPALAGFMKQDFRANAMYRNQWKQANSTFSTIAFGADANLIPAKLKGDKIGIGILVFRDQMGNEILTNNSIYGTLSYIKTLDAQKRHKISVGTQFGMVQKKIDYSSFYFGKQIVDYQINTSLASGENVDNSISYFNMNAGAFYTFKMLPSTDLHLGLSLFNLLKPKENLADQSVEKDLNKLKNRSIINLGARQRITKRLYIHPEILFMNQSKARDFNPGAALEYALTANPDLVMVQLGAWFRTMDAAIIYGGLKYHNIHIGLSYDITNSTFNDIKDSPEVKDDARIGAFEITLTYLGFFKRALPYEKTVPCIFF